MGAGLPAMRPAPSPSSVTDTPPSRAGPLPQGFWLLECLPSFRQTAAQPMTQPSTLSAPHVAIIGGGPSGLMAAEVLSQAGIKVDLYDGMPSVGRKFLLAGVGGMTSPTPKPTRHSFRATPNGLHRSPRYCAALAPKPCANGFTTWASTPLSAARAGSFRPT